MFKSSCFLADMKTINRNCFERCIINPSGKLENAEQVDVRNFCMLIIDMFVSLYGSIYGNMEYRYIFSRQESNIQCLGRMSQG